ncbi:hypothetical protein P0136_10575 [Lentisphaerota bacterium ZTH]|nr:hypothetical protein JYG24_11910 [Lentisphaerota bacterium]WET05805.1 hypothetical protein P0136_10575 [Lentisphaerota bacterium ZTH]
MRNIQFRLTTEEKDAIQHRANCLDLTVAEFVRCCAARYKKKKLLPYDGDLKRGTDTKLTIDNFPYNNVSGDLLRRLAISQLDDLRANPLPLPEPLPQAVIDEAFKCAIPAIY